MSKRIQQYFTKLAGLFVLSCLLCKGAAAQTIHSAVDKKDILIGEQIKYDLRIDLPSGEYKIDMQLPDSIPHFEIVSKTAGDTVDKKGNYSWNQHLVITSFDSGAWNFPALQYKITHLNTSSQPLSTDSFKVSVGYMPIDKGGQPRDIRTVIEVSFFDWFWVWIGAGVLALLIILFFVYRYIKKNKKPKDPFKNALSAYEEATAALDDLRRKNASQTLSVKEFYTALAEVFKRYYGRTVGKDLSNNTSSDILSGLKSYELKATTASTTAQTFHTVDAVKFAKYHPTFTENEAAIDYVRTTVDEIEQTTKNKPV